MTLIASLLVMTALALASRPALKAAPWACYIVAAFVAAAAVFLTVNPHPSPALRVMAFAVQKGQAGFALFAVVMFIGVFEQGSWVRQWLGPVRAELSVTAAILICAHFGPYMANYLVLSAGLLGLKTSVFVSLLIAMVLLVLLVLLTATSLKAVKAKMSANAWHRVQACAYVFFALVYLHLLGYLLVPAMSGSATAPVLIGVYTLVFAAYALLRVRKALLDRRQSIAQPATI